MSTTQWVIKMQGLSMSVHLSRTSHGATQAGQSSEMKRAAIAVNTILPPPKKVGFSTSVESTRLGQKIGGTLGRNIVQLSYRK